MGELEIKTHDFEAAKKGLKEFSQKEAKELALDTVKTNGGLFGLGNHKVTGNELNDRLSVIQKHLIDINNTNNSTIKEFRQIYSALEALDKDYIQAILISIKATEETSKSIEDAQEQIKKIVYDQKKTLEVLKKFKRKLDNYAHLEDIDEIWSNYEKSNKEILELSNSINDAMFIGNANAKKIDKVDTVLENTENKIKNLEECVKEQGVQLESVIEFTCRLKKIIHLQNIDEIWSSNAIHSDKLYEIQRQNEEINSFIHNNKERVDVIIDEVIKNNSTTIEILSKKIKYAYLIAGISFGLALIGLIIIFLKVI